MESKTIEHVVIVGGGTSGWLAAAYLTRIFGPKTMERLKVTLVESKDIGTIGVGEATIPTMKATLRRIGIDEVEFMKKTNATLKLGIKFVNWHEAPEIDPNDSFFHPFGSLPQIQAVGAASYWLKNRERLNLRPFADCFSIYSGLAYPAKSPKRLADPAYQGRAIYAYHIDATLFGQYLREVATGRGVNHIIDNVTRSERDEHGHVDHIKLQEHGELRGDLYLDCTGFRSVLMQNTPFVSYGDSLLCDSAIAIPCPWEEEVPSRINSYTTATALKAGWSWDIPLYSRRGRGYVYSGRHASEDEAETEFRKFIGDEDGKLPARHLKMRVGRRTKLWDKNCVALGLSGGFIEPLESTAIYLVEMGLNLLALNFPDKDFHPGIQKRYNTAMTDLYDHTMDFIVYHYCITNREDSPFWEANKYDIKIPDNLNFLMDMWLHKVPTHFDFTATVPLFGYLSYIFIMAGHNAWPQGECSNFPFLADGAAARSYNQIQAKIQRMKRNLPDHARFIHAIHTGEIKLDGPPKAPAQTDHASAFLDPLGRN